MLEVLTSNKKEQNIYNSSSFIANAIVNNSAGPNGPTNGLEKIGICLVLFTTLESNNRTKLCSLYSQATKLLT